VKGLLLPSAEIKSWLFRMKKSDGYTISAGDEHMRPTINTCIIKPKEGLYPLAAGDLRQIAIHSDG